MNHWELEQDFLQQHINHAYLLVGDTETTLADATAFAMALNCLSPAANGACGTCRHCALAKANSFCDFTILESEKAAYSVEEIRKFNQFVQYTPQEGRYRVFILKDIEQLSVAATNAMLKTIEEPTPETVILLLAENEEKILPTILSRCHVLRYTTKTEVTTEDLDNSYELLSKLPHCSMDTLFAMGEKYTAKNKEDLASLLYAADQIVANSYRNCFEEGKTQTQLLQNYDKNTLFALWEEIHTALKYLEAKVTPRIIADTFFLAAKELLA